MRPVHAAITEIIGHPIMPLTTEYRYANLYVFAYAVAFFRAHPAEFGCQEIPATADATDVRTSIMDYADRTGTDYRLVVTALADGFLTEWFYAATEEERLRVVDDGVHPPTLDWMAEEDFADTLTVTPPIVTPVTTMPTLAEQIADAKKLLVDNGHVVLRESSYRKAQERQRMAETRAFIADEQRDGQRKWMERDVFPRERYLADRLTFVYGVARAHGATAEELSGDWVRTDAPLLHDELRAIMREGAIAGNWTVGDMGLRLRALLERTEPAATKGPFVEDPSTPETEEQAPR